MLAVRRRRRSSPPVYLAATTVTQRGAYSHTRLLRTAYTGPLCDLTKNGVTTQSFSPNAQGLLDSAAVIAWAAGAVIRVSKVYNQGTQAGGTADAVQAADASRPILDPANIQSDGLWPASFNGFAGKSGEQNLWLDIGATLTHNRGNHTHMAVLDGMSNVGVQTPNNTVQSLTLAVGADRTDMNIGDDSFAGNFGLGVVWGVTPTKTFPTPNILVPVNRCVIAESQATVAVVDGVAAPSINLNLNNVDNFTVGGTGQTTGATNSGRIGQGTGGATTGAGMRWYGSLFFSNHVEATAERSTILENVKAIFNISTAYDGQVLITGSSTSAGYRSNANGFATQLKGSLSGTPRIDVIARAGTNTTVITANRVVIFAQLKAGLTKAPLLILYNVRNDIEGGANGTTLYNNDFLVQLAAARAAVPGVKIVAATQVPTLYTSQAAADAQLAAYNALIMNAANQATHNYVAVDTWALFPDFNDTTYYDPDKIHLNQAAGIPRFLAPIATAINAIR